MTRFKFRHSILPIVGVCLSLNIHPVQAETQTIEETLCNSTIGSMPAYSNSMKVNVPPEAQGSMGGVTSNTVRISPPELGDLGGDPNDRID